MSPTTALPPQGFRRGPADELPTELPPQAGRAAAGIAIVLVAQLMIVLDATVVNVALPRIDADLGFGPASLSWVLNAYTLAFGGLLLLGGRLGDVLGRRRTFVVGLAVFTLASALGGLAQTPGQLVATRALQGVGAALAAPSVLALLTTSAPDAAARNRALALFGAVSSGGASIGLLLGGLLTDIGSWRWTLFINVPLGIVVLLLVGRFVDETARRPGRFDLVGAASATVGAVSVVWALIGAPEHGWGSLRTIGGFALGAALLLLLARTETRHPHPMVQPHLVRSRPRVGALVAMALVVGANLSMFFLVVQYAQVVLGFGPLMSGVAFLPFSLGVFAMSRLTPSLIARIGPRAMVMAGTAALTVGYAWLSTAGTDGTYLGTVFGPMLVAGLSTGLVFMPITVTVLTGVEPEHAGSASGLLQTTQQLGSAVGVAVIVSVYAAGAVPGQLVPGLQAAFLTSAGFAALALLAAAVLLRSPAPAAVEVPDAPQVAAVADAA
ncbi:EmrB/QacA subfamily drug resistance transporter [Nocardioides cavernae]|uniref:EmrB/QacA subfamily drug resistance transporter n=1 Tax=Nocardioides cavernae TaxID=1921566 RepID=A0A7Y9H0X3_9ACTN|nr:MFS transporter [Nocardioides cavernae]NYE35944.1 EmrB/QacA subfamily drug resistance transporter [Nocardioides cavernae]